MSNRGALPLLLLVWLMAAPPAAAQEAGEGVWFAERITAGDAPVRVEYLWSKGRRFRAEWVVTGVPIVTIVTGDRYIMYERLGRKGVSIERGPKALRDDRAGRRPFGNDLDALIAEGAELIGTEKVVGRECDLWRVTDGRGRREACVTSDALRLPIFVRAWMRESSLEIMQRYVEWSQDIELPDHFFEPPSDVVLEHLSYDDYLERAPKERVGPFPPLYRDLLHGLRE